MQALIEYMHILTHQRNTDRHLDKECFRIDQYYY